MQIRLEYYRNTSWLSAAARTAGARWTSTTATNGVGRGDAETGAWASINIFNIDGTTGINETFFNKKCQVVLVVNFVVFFWLIQSQSQWGAWSASLHKGNAQSRFNIVLAEILFEFGDSQVSYGKRHVILLLFILASMLMHEFVKHRAWINKSSLTTTISVAVSEVN